MSEVIKNINWNLLRKQKNTLVFITMKRSVGKKELNDIDGIIQLLDALQDEQEDQAINNKSHSKTE